MRGVFKVQNSPILGTHSSCLELTTQRTTVTEFLKNKVLQPFRSQSMSTACQRLLDLEVGLSIQESPVTMWTLVSSPTLVKVSDLVSEPRNSSLNGCKEIWRRTQLLELTSNTIQQPPSLELKALLLEYLINIMRKWPSLKRRRVPEGVLRWRLTKDDYVITFMFSF